MGDTHFDAVVVGSGFGGSVMAFRLAEAGLSVCLLERGKTYPPGSFPRSPIEMRNNFWDPSEGLYGMYDLWSFSGLEALVCSGLGGGSLIYANVLLRKDERWFVREDSRGRGYEYWPITRADLEPHYDRVEKMLNAQRYPFDHLPYSETSKTKAMKEAADELGLEWQLPKLAVTFGNPEQAPVPGEPIVEEHPNLHRRTRYTCRLCGECDVGCNFGSKNTLDYTFLTHAARHGAEIRPLHEVRSFEPRGEGGYAVRYVRHDLRREGAKTNTRNLPTEEITCRRLILAAGALGTPYLLLGNRSAVPHISGTLGERFCGNGDLLGFATRSTERRNGTTIPRLLDPSGAPVITSAIRVPDEADGGSGRGFYVEDGGYPEFVGWMLETADIPGALRRFLRFALHRVWARISKDPKSNLGAAASLLLGDCALSSGSMPMLGMGRDIPDGKMDVRGSYLQIDWTTKTSKAYFDRVKRVMEDVARHVDADFSINPTWYLRRVITVHPLGGCPMGRNKNEGVVNSYGQVFDHPDLYVVDGSAMPGPVGANPSLTIAAFADRVADGIVEGAERR